MVEMVKQMYTQNAGEFTFAFTGSIDKEVLRGLVEQYIASLPGKEVARQEPAINPAFEIATGSNTFTFKQKMEIPQTYAAIDINGKAALNQKNVWLSEIAAKVVSEHLLKEVREDRGATYSIHCNSMTKWQAT